MRIVAPSRSSSSLISSASRVAVPSSSMFIASAAMPAAPAAVGGVAGVDEQVEVDHRDAVPLGQDRP